MADTFAEADIEPSTADTAFNKPFHNPNMASPSVTTNLAPKITDSTLALYAAALAFEEAAVAQATVTSSHAASTNMHLLTTCTIRPSIAAAAFMVGTNTGRSDDG